MTRTETKIVVLITCIFAALAIPYFIRARSKEATKERDGCISILRTIDIVKDNFAYRWHKANGADVVWHDLDNTKYPLGFGLMAGSSGQIPTCPGGGIYTIGKVGEKPKCSIIGHTLPDSNWVEDITIAQQ